MEARLDGVTPELKAHANSSGGGNAVVLYEFWDSAKISGSCPLSPDPGYLAPCIEFRWKVQGKLFAAGTGGLIGNAEIDFDAYVNDGFDPPHGGGAAGFAGFTESTSNFAHCDADNSCAAENDVSRSGSFLLSASGISPGLFRDGSTVGWGAFVTARTGSVGIAPDSPYDSSGEASFDALKRGVSLVILSRDPATKIEPSAAAIASGKAWKQEFGRWDVGHCPPFTPDVPTREFTVAYLPARYKAGTSHLSIQQIQDRADYVTDYYYQQSMCSVLITPWIVTDQNTDGWLNLPNTEADYNVAGQTSTLAENIPLAHIWLDAFVAASIASPDFLLRQQTPPPFGGFDAVVVIDTAFNTLKDANPKGKKLHHRAGCK